MSRQQRRNGMVLSGLLLAALGVGWTFAQTQAKPPPAHSLLPMNALVYVSSDGSLLHEEAWKQTAAYQSLEASGLWPALKQAFDRGLARIEDPQTSELVVGVLTGLSHLQNHGFSLAATVNVPEGALPAGYVVLVLHEAGGYEPSLAGFVEQVSEGELQFEQRERQGRRVTSAVVPGTPGVEIAWWNEGGHLIVIAGIGGVEATLAIAAGDTPNITHNPLWEKYVTVQRDFDVTTHVWVDAAAIRELVSPIPLPLEQADPNTPPVRVGDVLALLGLDGINTIVNQSGYKGAALWGETWIEAPAPRQGLLGLSDTPALSLEDLPPLPESLTTFMALRMETGRLYKELLAIARTAIQWAPVPDGRAQLEEALAQSRAFLGFDLNDGLLRHLGPSVVAYDDPRQGILSLGRGVLIEVKDPEAVRRSLDQLLAVIVRESDGELSVRRTRREYGELVTVQFGPSAFGQCYAIIDRWLVLGQPQVIDAFALRRDGKLPRWKPTPEHAAAFAELPSRFSSVTVSDPRGGVNLVMGLAPTLVAFAKTALLANPELGFDLPLQVEDLPPAELISAPLFPNVMIAEVSDAGFHYRSRGSFPGLPLVGSGDAATTTAVVAVGVALLLPAVQSARSAARRAQSQNNLKQLALALHNYEAVHGHFPAGAVENADLDPEERLSWLVQILPYIEQQALFQKFDLTQGWGSRGNIDWSGTVVEVFLNPEVAGDPIQRQNDGNDVAVTHYVGIAGLGDDGPLLPVNDPKAGMFGVNRVTRFADVHDGTSNTLMISEASENYGPWVSGGRATIRPFTRQPYINGPDGIGSPFRGGANMSFADGAVRFINSEIDPSVLEAMTTIRGGEVIPRQ